MSQIQMNRRSIIYIIFIAISTTYIIYLRHVNTIQNINLNEIINNLKFQLNEASG